MKPIKAVLKTVSIRFPGFPPRFMAIRPIRRLEVLFKTLKSSQECLVLQKKELARPPI